MELWPYIELLLLSIRHIFLLRYLSFHIIQIEILKPYVYTFSWKYSSILMQIHHSQLILSGLWLLLLLKTCKVQSGSWTTPHIGILQRAFYNAFFTDWNQAQVPLSEALQWAIFDKSQNKTKWKTISLRVIQLSALFSSKEAHCNVPRLWLTRVCFYEFLS